MTRIFDDSDSQLVLRTINIPKNLDDELRSVAFYEGTSKSELIRRGIRLVLKEMNADRQTDASQNVKVNVAAEG